MGANKSGRLKNNNVGIEAELEAESRKRPGFSKLQILSITETLGLSVVSL